MGTPESPTYLFDRKWPFRFALVGWLAIGVAAWFAADGLGRPGQVVLAGLWLVGLGLLLRLFIQSLFGPVLAFDALRFGRRRRQIWFRVGYAILLGIILTWVYISWFSFSRRYGGAVRVQDLAKLAEVYFYVYMVVQFIVVCVLTPASVAGAITDEKERRTLEFLLATDLRDREILLGKLASRAGGMLLFLMAGLPVLAFVQFFGGIDPDLVLAGFAATFLVVLTLAALSVAASVLARKTRDAIALAYLVAIAYVLLSGIGYVLSTAPPFSGPWDVFGFTITSDEIAYPFACGNPFVMVPLVVGRRAAFGTDLFTGLAHFALFHIVVIALLVTWAGMKLRSIALSQRFGSSRRSFLRRLITRAGPQTSEPQASATSPRRRRPVRASRPDVGDAPMIWKEVFVDSGLRMGMFSRIVIFALVAFSFVPIGFIVWLALIETRTWRNSGPWWSAARWEDFGQGMNVYLRVVSTIVTSLVFLAIAVRGAGCVTGERERHTLDMLLTTPMSAGRILWAKWWGCLLGMRFAWAWVFGLWAIAIAAGGVHPIMFPAMVLSVAVYASGFAWIGLYCSVAQKTTLRATMAAIVLSVAAGGGYFLIFLFCCLIPLSFSNVGPGAASKDAFDLGVTFLCSFSPPVNMAFLPIRDFDAGELEFTLSKQSWITYPPFWLIGLVAWAALSVILSRATIHRFRRMANRLPIEPMPERRPPAARPRGVPPPLPPRTETTAS